MTNKKGNQKKSTPPETIMDKIAEKVGYLAGDWWPVNSFLNEIFIRQISFLIFFPQYENNPHQ
jgi:hypothetical protein